MCNPDDDDSLTTDSPATLVAIAKAAHLTGDRDLERAARKQLEDRHGIRIRFVRRGKPQGGNHG